MTVDEKTLELVVEQILVMSRQRFEKAKDVIGGIAYPAHKYGKTSMRPPEQVNRLPADILA